MEGESAVKDRSFMEPLTELKETAGKNKVCVVVEQRPEVCDKGVKFCGLDPLFHSKGKETREACPVEPVPIALDLNANVCEASTAVSDEVLQHVDATKNNSRPRNQEMRCNGDANFINSVCLGLDLNAEDVSSSINNEPFYRPKHDVKFNAVDDSESASSIGHSEEKDPMRGWKEMKQNGFVSSLNVANLPTSKPPARKSKSNGLKRKIELAKREQVDRFAKIAAPSGLLNGLNPGIINHVRNSKQVHSIIEALVRSEKQENHYSDGKRVNQSSTENKENNETKDPGGYNGSGINRFNCSHEDRCLDSLSRGKQISTFSMPLNREQSFNLELRATKGALSMTETRKIGKFSSTSQSKRESDRNIVAPKLISTAASASENNSSLSNENSENLANASLLSVQAANIAFQWLELLQQDLKGRLSALQRSQKRVQAVIQTELPLLVSKELLGNERSCLDSTRISVTGFSGSAAANAHQARWSSLFDQMHSALCEEEKQLETMLKQVKDMHLQCKRGLLPLAPTFGFQQMGTSEKNYGVVKADYLESELAVRAAAASIYSTCNFIKSMENLPCP